MFHAIITHMAITPSLRFLYIFDQSGLLCDAAPDESRVIKEFDTSCDG